MDRPRAEAGRALSEAQKARLLAEGLAAAGEEIELDARALHHVRVLRLGPGDRVTLFDGRGLEAEARILSLHGEGLRCSVGARARGVVPGVRVELIQCMPKGDKLDGIVRMATELGVAAIHLAISERTIARAEGDRALAKEARFRRIAEEAARQSGAAEVPQVYAPAPLEACALRASAAEVKLFFYELGGQSLASALDAKARHVALVVGPEGGFSEAEASRLVAHGYPAIGLGPRVLRVETAAPVAIALALARLGALE